MRILLGEWVPRLTQSNKLPDLVPLIPDANPDPAVAKRAFDAMVQMQKIDIAAIEAACQSSF